MYTINWVHIQHASLYKLVLLKMCFTSNVFFVMLIVCTTSKIDVNIFMLKTITCYSTYHNDCDMFIINRL